MNGTERSWIWRRRRALAAAAVPRFSSWHGGHFVLKSSGLIRRSASRRRSVSTTDPQPLYTGQLEGEAHQTSGRATIYKTPDGAKDYVRLTSFTTSNGPDVHVLLARSDDQNLTQEIVKGQLDSVELGLLKGNKGDQNYDLPASVDLQKYNAVVIYCERFHAVFGVARLESF